MRALAVNQIDAQGPRRFQSVITVGFATGEIGFRVSFAPQQSQPVHVRFGSKPDQLRCPPHVCLAPDNGLMVDIARVPCGAKSRHRACLFDHPIGPLRSWRHEKSQVESSEHQDNANIHYQPFPESVSEEHEIYTDYNGCHCQHVKHHSYPSVHFSTTSFHFLRSGRGNETDGIAKMLQ